MEAHMACDQAWVSWVNTGRGEQRRHLAESAVFRYQGGAWRMAFLHSARVPPPS